MKQKLNIIYNYIGNISVLIINFLFVPIYLNYLSTEEYGLIAFFSTLVSALVFLDFGLGITINREISKSISLNESPKKTGNIIRTFELTYWFIALFIGFFIFFSSNILSTFWFNVDEITGDKLSFIVSLMGVALIFRWPISFYNNALSGFQKMDTLNQIKIFVSLLNILVTLILFKYFEIGIAGVFILLTLVYFVHTFLLTSSVWLNNGLFFFNSIFNLSFLKNSFKYISGMGYYSIAGTFYVIIDKIIVSKFFSMTEFAYYSIASTLCLVLLQFVYPVSAALFPAFVENYTKGENNNSYRLFRQGYQIIITLVFSVSSIFIIFKSELLLLWTGDMLIAKESSLFFLQLIFGTIFYSLHILIFSIYTSLGKTKTINKLQSILLMIYLLLIFISVYFNNILMISYSWLTINFILFISSFIIGYSILGNVKMNTFIKKDFLLPFILLLLITFISSFINLPEMKTFYLILIIFLSSLLLFFLFFLTTPYLWNYIKQN